MKTALTVVAAIAAANFIACPAFAEDPAMATATALPAQPQAAMLVETPQENIVRAGTEIPLITREELTTKKKLLRVGQRVQLEVASNVMINGMAAIPIGTPAVGEVTEVRNKGMWGKSGYIAVRIVSMRLGDRTIRLSGTFDDKGVTGTGGVVAAVALVPVMGFFTTGTSAMIPTGSAVKSFLEEDIRFEAAAQTPTIMLPPVQASTPQTEPAPESEKTAAR